MKGILIAILTISSLTLCSQNIALGKTADQSATYSSGYIYLASNAIDGNRSGIHSDNSITHTPAQTNPWWRLDLLDEYNIGKIDVYNRTSCCMERLKEAKVYLGNEDSYDPLDGSYTYLGTLGSETINQINNLAVDGRYILIFLEGTNKILSLAEVEVFVSENQWNTNTSGVHYVGGNVGIGTSTPDAPLTVNGQIHTTEVKVDLSVPAPDYVFYEDYDLKTLEEIQEYIDEHGHLPNIPSAKEIEANGIELGLMNMKLLEKIEELTLYIIKQEQQLKQLPDINQRLQELEKDYRKGN